MLKYFSLKAAVVFLFLGILIGFGYAYRKHLNKAKVEMMFNNFEPLKDEIRLDFTNNYYTLDSSVYRFPKSDTYIIGLWGTYCSICIDKMDYLDQALENYPDFEVVFISYENIGTIKNFLKYNRYKHLTFVKSNVKFAEMGVFAVPQYILVENGKGKLVDFDELKKILND
jgi:thiol-disulfide isomerase/thioredoxin